MGGEAAVRDHLFVSYATEDGALAEWLTLRLTAEGYRVWCDRIKLLGGEPYPSDIDAAIKTQTFRCLALLSRASIAKPNPTKERTLALNLSRARGEKDFLVPLNVDGMRADELDWMTSDLTFIPFSPSWAEGLDKLLTKLRSISTPRPLPAGRTLVQEIARSRSTLTLRSEKLWTNLLEIQALPSVIRKIRPRKDSGWPTAESVVVREGDLFWTFEAPPGTVRLDAHEELDVESARKALRKDGADPILNVIKQLVAGTVRARCFAKGMKETDDGLLYFPMGLLPSERLPYVNYKGRRTYVNAVGNRTFRTSGATTVSRYHLAVELRPRMFQYGGHFLEVQIRVHVTDGAGGALDDKARLRRRKKICKSWWNHQWLSRLLATLEWLGSGQDTVTSGTGKGQLTISLRPLSVQSAVGIDEGKLADSEAPGETGEVDDEAEGDDDAGILEDDADSDPEAEVSDE